MSERIEEKYTLKVWSDSYNRYVEYFHYTTLERLKHQIERCIKDYQKAYYLREGWWLWKGNKPIDFKNVKYIIEHKRYKITKEELLSEVVENDTL